jgi:hypothetical protein
MRHDGTGSREVPAGKDEARQATTAPGLSCILHASGLAGFVTRPQSQEIAAGSIVIESNRGDGKFNP